MMNLQNLTQDDRYLLARVADAFRTADSNGRPKYTGFLDERQQDLVKAFAAQQHFHQYLFFGGFESAARKVLGAFPDYTDLMQEPAALFNCVQPVTLRYRAQDKLSHRDFLGSLMGLNITRESVGDILVGEGIAVLFVLRPVLPIILEELAKVGRVGVRCENALPSELPLEEHFLEIKDTVSSLRLDCIVSVLTKLSREKSAALIAQGLVTQNYEIVQSNSRAVQAGDTVSIRGYGKFSVAEAGNVTRKGRIQVLCKKYL